MTVEDCSHDWTEVKGVACCARKHVKQGDCMALIECKECGHEISTKASACPSCGARRGSHFIAKAFLTIVALVGIVVVIALANPTSTSASFTKQELCDQSAEAAHYIASLSSSPDEATAVTRQVIADRKYPILGDKVTASIGAMVALSQSAKTPDEMAQMVRSTCEHGAPPSE